jgi:TonB-linked SusC/RagA family outer membrane protein
LFNFKTACIMTSNRLLKALILCPILLLLAHVAQAQKTITGKVSDEKGSPVTGASVVIKGGKTGTTTDATGAFSLNVPAGTTALTISYVGYVSQDADVSSVSSITIALAPDNANLTDVVVIGYGTTRKKDLTGSVASVQAKDFNKGVISSPEQLLQGKVAGLQITNSSGQPGAITIVKIRGNNSIRSGNSPLYVVDGIPLDGRSPRPGFSQPGVGTTPGGDPLTYINPNDIASIDILKDASASAIYGSRGANGVVLITLKKGQVGNTHLEANAYVGYSDIMRSIDVLDANGYRNALDKFDAPNSDSGASIKPFDAILQKGMSQSYNVGLSGGNENGKYRASFMASQQDGIIRKSGLNKYIASFNGQYAFLDKKLNFNFNVIAANTEEQVAPISQDAGSGGNIISLGLIWNPTLPLKRSNGQFNQENPSGQVNPLALSEAYNDHINISTVLANASVAYKFTPWLEYKFVYGINYGTGVRKSELQGWIKGTGSVADGQGTAAINDAQLSSQTITHTLTFNKKIGSNLNLNALAGYEYWTTSNQGSGTAVYAFDYNLQQNNLSDLHYWNTMQDGKQDNLGTGSYKDPTVELQSYFARAVLNYKDKYLLTATIRSDGSSKFGSNNKYAYFPSAAAAWNISNENFMSGSFFNNLKLRVGYGATGNQEFAPDAPLDVFRYNSYQSVGFVHYGNPNLKWETVTSFDGGIDFAILHNRVSGYIDYFVKRTDDPIFLFTIAQPTAGGTVYKNMDGNGTPKAWVTNKGMEISLSADIIVGKDFTWSVTANATFLKNKFYAPTIEGPLAFTGALHGQGTSGAYSQAIVDDQPVDVFYVPEFLGFDDKGIGTYSSTPIYAGDPNPSVYMGFSTDLAYKKFGLTINMHGTFGNKIYNNTAMSVLNISNIIGGRNIASDLVNGGENTANAITPSTRFLESGDYVKLGNATIHYNIGSIANAVKNASIYISGSNLFTISDYKGFDPEVNVDKSLNGIPSVGVDYIGFPTARTIIFGVNFTF